jgi:hypothetical protein
MKVKRFNNLWTMGLILCAGLLLVIYIAKLFFPHFVIEVSHTQRIIEIGHYIDNHKWAWYVANTITSYFICYFICTASCQKKFLNYKEHIIIAITLIIMFLVKEFMPQYYTTLNYITMILLPCIMKAKLLPTTIVFTSLNLLQLFTLEIRGLMLMITDFNFATALVLLIDAYILQILLYLALNYKKENN